MLPYLKMWMTNTKVSAVNEASIDVSGKFLVR